MLLWSRWIQIFVSIEGYFHHWFRNSHCWNNTPKLFTKPYCKWSFVHWTGDICAWIMRELSLIMTLRRLFDVRWHSWSLGFLNVNISDLKKCSGSSWMSKASRIIDNGGDWHSVLEAFRPLLLQIPPYWRLVVLHSCQRTFNFFVAIGLLWTSFLVAFREIWATRIELFWVLSSLSKIWYRSLILVTSRYWCRLLGAQTWKWKLNNFDQVSSDENPYLNLEWLNFWLLTKILRRQLLSLSNFSFHV